MKADDLHRLIWMSRPLMQAAEACVDAGLRGTGLTVRMRAVLEILHVHGDQTVPEIAAKLEIQRQYVQLMCNETLESGFVAQRVNPRHRRSPILALTERGRDVITAIISNELRLTDEIGANFSDTEVSTALEVVLAVTDALRKRVVAGK
jgi:DNA-binding MarR family transcriptional regulator